MRVHLDCFPCFLRQSIIALGLGTRDELLQERILKHLARNANCRYLSAACCRYYPSLDILNLPKAIQKRRARHKQRTGKFETVTGIQKNMFFLFQSKCDVVSKELGLSKGSMLLKKS